MKSEGSPKSNQLKTTHMFKNSQCFNSQALLPYAKLFFFW